MRRHANLCSIVLMCLIAAAAGATPADAADASNELVDQIVKLLGNPDREFRAAALEQVRTAAKGSDQTKKFAARLPTLESSVRAELITALADRGDAAAKP